MLKAEQIDGNKEMIPYGTQTKKANRYTLITNHCVVDVAMGFLNKNVLHRLKINHLRLLFNTPFLHLFVIPKNVHASNAILHCILTRWHNAKKCFKLDNKMLVFTSEAVSHIMCLPSIGDRVILTHKRDSSSTASLLRQRYFPGMALIRRKDLEEAITNALDDPKCPARDVVSLLVLYLLTTVLLPNTGGHVPLHLFKYAEQLDELKKYNWGEAVYELLDMHIPKCALWCKMQDLKQVGKKKGKEEEEEDAVPLRKKSPYMPGCCLALIVWFFEVTKFSIATETSGHVPRYLDWYKGISKKKQRPAFEDDLDKVRISQIKNKIYMFSYEKPLEEGGFIAAQHLDYILDEEKFRTTLKTPIYQMLVELTPVFMKFGVVPCNVLKKKVGNLNPKIVYFEKTFPKLADLEQYQIEKLCEGVHNLKQDEIVYSAKRSEQKLEETSKRKVEVQGKKKRKINDDCHEDAISDYEEVQKDVEKGKDSAGSTERTQTDDEIKDDEKYCVAVEVMKELALGRRIRYPS